MARPTGFCWMTFASSFWILVTASLTAAAAWSGLFVNSAALASAL